MKRRKNPPGLFRRAPAPAQDEEARASQHFAEALGVGANWMLDKAVDLERKALDDGWPGLSAGVPPGADVLAAGVLKFVAGEIAVAAIDLTLDTWGPPHASKDVVVDFHSAAAFLVMAQAVWNTRRRVTDALAERGIAPSDSEALRRARELLLDIALELACASKELWSDACDAFVHDPCAEVAERAEVARAYLTYMGMHDTRGRFHPLRRMHPSGSILSPEWEDYLEQLARGTIEPWSSAVDNISILTGLGPSALRDLAFARATSPGIEQRVRRRQREEAHA